MKLRRGVSLAELLLAMSASSVILTMSVGMIHRVMHTQSRTRSFFDGERATLRLSRQFRQDVHSARSALTDADRLAPEVLLQLEMEDEQTIEYHHSNAGLERVLLEKDEVRSREEYAVQAEMSASFRQEESPAVVVLSIAPRASAGESEQPLGRPVTKPVSLYVEARLGADRFTNAFAAQEDAP
jgi:hypothetical protein